MIAVSELQRSIAETDYLKSSINSMDKEPSWDGNIYVYDSKNLNKSSMFGKVPVQVKGKEIKRKKDLSKSKISYSVEVSDLKNYLNEGGTIFFVVLTDGKNSKIYYNSLIPVKLKDILEKIDNQVTKSIQLTLFPSDNIKKCNIFREFCIYKREQFSFINQEIHSLDYYIENGLANEILFSISSYDLDKKNPVDILLQKDELCMKVKTSDQSIPIPTKIIENNLDSVFFVEEEISKNISIGDKLFYNKYRVIKSKYNTTLKIGHSIFIDLNKNKFKIQYRPTSKFSNRILDLEFFIDFIRCRSFYVDNEKNSFDIQESVEEKVKLLEEELKILKEIKEVLDVFILTNELDVTKLTNKDMFNVRLLRKTILNKQPVELTCNVNPFSIIKIGNLQLIVFIEKSKVDSNKYIIQDFFKADIKSFYKDCDGNIHETSKYHLLKKEDYLIINNIDWDRITTSFKKIKNIESNYLNSVLLEFISIYDLHNNKKVKEKLFIQLIDLAEYLKDMDDNAINCLNLLQITKRHRILNDIEKNQIYDIIDDNYQDKFILIGANLLLDNIENALYYFNKLSNDEQKKFLEYPISIYLREHLNSKDA